MGQLSVLIGVLMYTHASMADVPFGNDNADTPTTDTPLDVAVDLSTSPSSVHATADAHSTTLSDSIGADRPITQLAGVRLNGTLLNKDDGDHLIDVLELAQEHYLAMTDLVEIIGITPTISQTAEQTVYEFVTPIGVARLAGADVRQFDGDVAGVDYVSFASLKKLGITARFSQSDLAVVLNMGYTAPTSKLATPAKRPTQYQPQSFGLTSVYLDSHAQERHSHTNTSGYVGTSMGAFGYALGGVWGIDARYVMSGGVLGNLSAKGTTALNNLYWSSSGKHWATRLGTNQSSGGQIGDYTGLTFAYSNKNIDRHLSALNTHTSGLLQGQQNDLQTIKGKGIGGGVAELRVEGRVVARVLVGLDGHYEFIGLDVGKLDNHTTFVEVALYEYPQAVQPVKIERIFVGKRKTRVATGEYLLEIGAGMAGNQPNHWLGNTTSHHWVGGLYGEYGLSNRLSVKASTGIQYNDHRLQGTHYVGANFVPARYTNLDVGYHHTPDVGVWQVDLTHQRPKLYLSYHLSRHDTRTSTPYHQLGQSLHAHYRPSDRLAISLSHKDQYQSGNQTKHEQLTQLAVDTTINEYLTGGASLNSLGRYRWRLLWQDKDAHQNQAGLQGDNHRLELSLRHRLNTRTTLGMTISHHYGNPILLYRGFVNRQLSRGTMSVGYSMYGRQFGLDGQWQYSPKQGVQLAVGYRHRHIDALGVGVVDTDEKLWQDKHFAYVKARFDWHKPHQRPLRLGAYPAQDKGTILVNVSHPREPALDTDQIRFGLYGINGNDTQQMVNATLISADDASAQYLIGGVNPSDYELRLDARHLPFEYSTNLTKPTLTVARYAPTVVNFALHSTFGVSGRLADGRANTPIGLFDQYGQQVGQDVSDEQGHFQVMELPSGTYVIQAEGYRPLTVVIADDVLMNAVVEPME